MTKVVGERARSSTTFCYAAISLFLGLLFVIEVQIPFDEVVYTSL